MDRMFNRVFLEGVGTFFLCCGVGLSLPSGSPFTVSATLFAAIGITGFASGAMFNPAVTTGVIIYKYLRRRMTFALLKEMLLMILVQFLFGFLGALMAWGLKNETGQFAVRGGYETSQAFFGELVWTALLVGGAIMVGNTIDSNLVAGMAVVASVFSGAATIGAVSGGAFNPAVGICVSLVHVINTGDSFSDWPIYLFAPLIGGVIGTFIAFPAILELEAKNGRSSKTDMESEDSLVKF